MKIEITMKKIIRVAMDFEATNEQIENLKYGNNPFSNQMVTELEAEVGEVIYDYAVNDLNGNEIVPWGKIVNKI